MIEGKTNIANIHKVLENPAGRRQAVSYSHCTVEELNLGWPRMENLIPGPPDNKSSTLTRMDLETPAYQLTRVSQKLTYHITDKNSTWLWQWPLIILFSHILLSRQPLTGLSSPGQSNHKYHCVCCLIIMTPIQQLLRTMSPCTGTSEKTLIILKLVRRKYFMILLRSWPKQR